MSQETDDKKEVYNSYFTRGSMKVVTPARTADVSSNELDAANNDASISDEIIYTTETLSTELNKTQKELIQSFLSLTLVSNSIEDTIIIVDSNGKETEDSLERRKKVLDKLKQSLQDNKALKNRILELYPDITIDLKRELGDEYPLYSSAASDLIKLCGSVNSIKVTHDSKDYYPNGVSFDTDVSRRYDEDDEYDTYEPAEQIKESEVKTDKNMLDFISKTLDHPSFISATLTEKRYMRRKIMALKNLTSEYEIDRDVIDKVEKVSSDTLTNGNLEKYSKYIKPDDRDLEY